MTKNTIAETTRKTRSSSNATGKVKQTAKKSTGGPAAKQALRIANATLGIPFVEGGGEANEGLQIALPHSPSKNILNLLVDEEDQEIHESQTHDVVRILSCDRLQ